MGAQFLVTGSAGHKKAFPRASLPPSFLLGSGSPDHPVRQTATALQPCATQLLETAATTTPYPSLLVPPLWGLAGAIFLASLQGFGLHTAGFKDFWL